MSTVKNVDYTVKYSTVEYGFRMSTVKNVDYLVKYSTVEYGYM